ncbi:MAG: AbrB family transcriptional regulator [Roseibium sp.]|nr:AbrB family transcriptional regulator [Roseibium sp.]
MSVQKPSARAAGTERHKPSPLWKDPDFWQRTGLTYAIAIAGALIAAQAGLPLAWMLGPFFACGAASGLGLRLRSVPFSREFAQITIGLGIGLQFSSATLVATLLLTPAMLAATLYVIGYTMVAAALFRPLAGVNRPTAFFATAAGGVADMAPIARDRGGDAASVGIVHALRVSMTVAIVPLLVVSFGETGRVAGGAANAGSSAMWLLPIYAGGIAFAWLVKRTRLPNPWLVAPMFFGIVLGASGTLTLAIPPLGILGAQLLLGTWLGCQFRKDLLLGLPRVAMAGIAVSLFMIIAAFAGALVLSAVTPLSLATSFLALAPAAVTEMVITAKTMHLDPEVITGFHIIRIFVICSTALLMYRIYCGIGRVLGRLAERRS